MAEKVTTDPESYSGGYVPAWAVHDGSWLFMPLMGHNHSPDTNNSVRVFDPDTGEWTYWQPDLSDQITREQWFAGENTEPQSASGRNNLWGWYLPWRDWLIIGAPGNSLAGNHGVYDITQKAWTHLVPNDRRSEAIPGIQYETEDAKAALSIWNAADATCEELKTLVRYGGKNDGILILIKEQEDGSFIASRYNGQAPGRRNSVRTAGVCRGEYFYVMGGQLDYQSESLSETWRLHIPTRQWDRLPDMPFTTGGYGTALLDTDNDRIVVVANDGTANVAVLDPEAETWTDVTSDLGLPDPENALIAFIPGHGIFLRGGTFRGGDWRTSTEVHRASFSDVDTAPEPDEEPIDDTPSNDGVVSKDDPYTPLSRQGKHLAWVCCPLDGRMYVFGGDYTTGDGAASYKRQVWSVDLDNESDMRLEAGYCPPSEGDSWPRGRCEAGWVWHTGEQVFYAFAGVYEENKDDSVCGFLPSNYAYVMRFDPQSSTWSVPQQGERSERGIAKHGFFDESRNRLITSSPSGGGTTLYAFSIDTGEWSVIATHTSYLWAHGDFQRRGRQCYFTDEGNARLISFDLDTDGFHDHGPLPEDMHADDDPDSLFVPSGILAYWSAKDLLIYTHNNRVGKLWAWSPAKGQWYEKDLTGLIDVPVKEIVSSPGALIFLPNEDISWNEDRPYYIIHDLDFGSESGGVSDEPEPEPTESPMNSVAMTGGMYHVLVDGEIVSNHYQFKEANQEALNQLLAGNPNVSITMDPIKVEAS